MGTTLRKFLIIFFVFLLFINLVSAIPIVEISVKPIFYEGDIINFSYEIVSSQDEFVKYILNIECEASPQALLETREMNLIANEPFFGEYVYGAVDENVKNGICMASVSILEHYQMDFTEHFEVINLLDFSITPLFCEDSLCEENSKVFPQGEDIYLDYESSIENPIIETTLTYPDNSTKDINLPSSIKAEQIGTYELYITASKEGYKTVSLNEQFAVIEGDVNIGYTNVSEDTTDLDFGEPDKKMESWKIFSLVGAIILIIVVLVILIKFIRKKEESVSQNIPKSDFESGGI